MKKLLIYAAAGGALCASGASLAAPWGYPYRLGGNLALYGSYMNQNDSQAGLSPDGGGGGAQLGLSLTPNFFIGGSYQYNYLHESDAPAAGFGLGPGTISYGEKVEQGRAGGGLVFPLPQTAVDIFGKIEYVHYDYQTVHPLVNGVPYGNSDRTNDDGVGYHIGFQTRYPGFSVYGSAGYLDLSRSDGPEFNVGFMLPLAPRTWGFVEYRYDDLRYSGYSDRNETNDVRAGVRLSF